MYSSFAFYLLLRLPATPEEEVMDTGSCNEDSEDEGTGIASPEARQRRKNLNLSPLRKQVRLPDMTKYPVQSISGLGVQELVRLATARGESRLLETRAGSVCCNATIRYNNLFHASSLMHFLSIFSLKFCQCFVPFFCK